MPPRPIKIVRVIARLNVGGPAIHVLWLTKRLGGDGFASVLVRGREEPHEGDMDWLAGELGVEPIRIPELGRSLSLAGDLRALIALYLLIRAEQPDVVHTHTAKAGALGRVAAWLAGVPVRVHTFHGHVFHGYFSPLQSKLVVLTERLLARITDRLIAVSGEVRDEIVGARIGDPEKVLTVPLGLDLSRLLTVCERRGELRRKLGFAPVDVLVGVVARLVPVKGHFHFLEAVRKLLDQPPLQPNLRFLLIGDGELRPRIEAEIERLGLTAHVTLTGFVQDVAPVYADLDLLVLPSLNEGLPVAIVEALSAGVPVVATRVGGVPELLEGIDSAVLVPAKDPAALAGAMAGVLARLDSFSANAQAHRHAAVESYSVDRLVRDLDALYRSLVPGDSP